MEEQEPKKKKVTYPPDTKGRIKRGPLDWSLDELIEYRAKGNPPARIPDAQMLYKLGTLGVSLSACADLFEISVEKFSSNKDWLDNWQRGRAVCSSRIRSSLVTDALERDMLTAKIYLDKTLGQDRQDPATVNVTINNAELQKISTEDLLEVAFRVADDDQDQEDTDQPG